MQTFIKKAELPPPAWTKIEQNREQNASIIH